jgi:hypothetical protein
MRYLDKVAVDVMSAFNTLDTGQFFSALVTSS